ncbi:hypothetical protein D9M71_473310 [compost metagenome]
MRPPVPRARSWPPRLSSEAAAKVRMLSLSMMPASLFNAPARLKSTEPAAICPALVRLLPLTKSRCLAKSAPWLLSRLATLSRALPERAERCPPWLATEAAARSRDCPWTTPPLSA